MTSSPATRASTARACRCRDSYTTFMFLIEGRATCLARRLAGRTFFGSQALGWPKAGVACSQLNASDNLFPGLIYLSTATYHKTKARITQTPNTSRDEIARTRCIISRLRCNRSTRRNCSGGRVGRGIQKVGTSLPWRAVALAKEARRPIALNRLHLRGCIISRLRYMTRVAKLR